MIGTTHQLLDGRRVVLVEQTEAHREADDHDLCAGCIGLGCQRTCPQLGDLCTYPPHPIWVECDTKENP